MPIIGSQANSKSQAIAKGKWSFNTTFHIYTNVLAQLSDLKEKKKTSKDIQNMYCWKHSPTFLPICLAMTSDPSTAIIWHDNK